MGLREDAWESRMPPDDPRLGPTYSQLRADLDEQARRIGMALYFTAEALGDADEMAERQIRGSYNLQRTLRRIKQALETGKVT